MKSLLGAGGLAEIYEAWQESVERRVALKVLRRAHAASQGPAGLLSRALIEQGRRMAALGTHDGLVAVHEVGVDTESGLAFIAMELLEGHDLREHVRRRGAVEAVEAVAFGASVAASLALFHQRGFVHGDVKPSNLFLHTPPGARRPTCKVLDPTAGARGSIGTSPVTITSPLYTAPEFIERRELSPRYDVYGLGLTLYELLVGTPPMAKNALSVHDIYKNQIALELPPLSSVAPRVPREVSDIVAGMTAKAPELRYEHAGTVASVLAECLSRLRAGPAKVHDRSPALALAAPSADPAPRRDSTQRAQYGPEAQVATVAAERSAPSFARDGVDEVALARIRLVDPTPPPGLDILAVARGPTRLLGLRFAVRTGVWTIGASLTSDFCVPHYIVLANHCELRVAPDPARPEQPWGAELQVVARAHNGTILIDGVETTQGLLRRGGTLDVGTVCLQRFKAGSELPPDSVPQVQIPPALLLRTAPIAQELELLKRTEELFLARSPRPSRYMRISAREDKADVEERVARLLLTFDRFIDDPRLTVRALAELLMVTHYRETQLQILEGVPLEEIIDKRLRPVIDWEQRAAARLAARRG